METLEKIKEWIDRAYQEYPGAALGIHEGGLEIRVFNPDTGDWYVGYELGGIPEDLPETDEELKEYQGPADDGLDYQTYLSEFEGGTYQQMCEYVHAEVDRCESWYVLRDLWNVYATLEEKEEFGRETVSGNPDGNDRYRGYMIACCRIIDHLKTRVKLEED